MTAGPRVTVTFDVNGTWVTEPPVPFEWQPSSVLWSPQQCQALGSIGRLGLLEGPEGRR